MFVSSQLIKYVVFLRYLIEALRVELIE